MKFEIHNQCGLRPLENVRLQIVEMGHFVPILKDMMKALPRDCCYNLVLQPEVNPSFLKEIIAGFRLGYVPRIKVMKQRVSTVFARDNALSATDQGEKIIVVPRNFEDYAGHARYFDNVNLWGRKKIFGRRILRSDLYWEGGNLIAASAHLIIGGFTIFTNMRLRGESRVQVVRAFEKEFGKPVVILGSHKVAAGQADFHVDFSVAVLEGAKGAHALVADPEEGIRLVNGDKERFLSEIRGKKILPPEKTFYHANRSWRFQAERRRRSLDEYGETLSRAGYQVSRIPDLSVAKDRNFLPGVPISATSTNVIMDGARRRAYGFRYGFPSIEKAARALFKKAGWQLLHVNDDPSHAHHYLKSTGGLRCLVGPWD